LFLIQDPPYAINSSDYLKECDSATDQVIRLARKEARELVMKKRELETSSASNLVGVINII